MNEAELKIVPLPPEKWKGFPIPMRYTTETWFDVVTERQEGGGWIVRLEKKRFDEPVTHTPEEYDFPDKLYEDFRPGAEAWGILSDTGELLGCVESAPEEWSNRLVVTEMWVTEELRRRGYGHRLMALAKKRAADEGRRAIILETQSCNTGAIAFYESEGFSLIGYDLCEYTNRDAARREVRFDMGILLETNQKEETMEPKTNAAMTVTAHSGCLGFPDNSIEAARAGVEAGADIVEIDLSFTDAGEPVLSHDGPKEGEESAPLSALFAFLKEFPGVRANVDIKSTARLEKVAPLAEEYGVLGQIFYTGVGDELLGGVTEKSPSVPRYLNVDVDKERMTEIPYLESLAEKVKNAGCVGINLQYRGLSAEMVSVFHGRGLLVSVWTVNKEEDMPRVIALKPDNITTRRPDLLIPLVRSL